MKILMISAGLAPKRTGGVPLYVADLRRELIRRGHDVIYLDTYCQDASRKPRIIQTCTSPPEYSFFNSGSRLPWGIAPHPFPLSDIRASREARECLLRFVERLRPEIIHFQETICFPLELVSSLRALDYKVVFTAQDYFSICPTIKLWKHDQQLCTLHAQELECHRCVRQSIHTRLPSSADWALQIVGDSRAFGARVLRVLLRVLGKTPYKLMVNWAFRGTPYRKRRLEAVAHLRSFNLLICMSKLQHSVMSTAIGEIPNCRQVYLSVSSYSERKPSGEQLTQIAGSDVTRFVALNINQIEKGTDVLLSAFQSLREDMKNVELHLFGEREVRQLPGVVCHGPYKTNELDAILSEMDVGIIPSIWAETYGYVGPEMLTRGIPLIVSTAGAMREYVIPYVNGLHFDPTIPGELKAAMSAVANDRELVKRLKANTAITTDGIVRFDSHVDEMEAIYTEVLSLPPSFHFES